MIAILLLFEVDDDIPIAETLRLALRQARDMASAAPGYAVLELVNVALTVVNAAKAFVSAFSGKWDNASFKLQELDGHYKQAEYYFLTLERNISDQGRGYPNYQVLQR